MRSHTDGGSASRGQHLSGTKAAAAGGEQGLKFGSGGRGNHQKSGQTFKIGQTSREMLEQGQRLKTGKMVSEGKVDSGFQNIIAAAFAKIPQGGKPESRSRSSKKLALDKLAEYRDSQITPSVEEEKDERKKLEKFISENVRKAAIVTAEGR